MIDSDSHHWWQLCQIALWETDPAKLLVGISNARSVVLDRIEDCSKSDGERAALRKALSKLDSLRRITEHKNGSIRG